MNRKLTFNLEGSMSETSSHKVPRLPQVNSGNSVEINFIGCREELEWTVFFVHRCYPLDLIVTDYTPFNRYLIKRATLFSSTMKPSQLHKSRPSDFK